MTESQIQKQIIDALKIAGHLVFRMNAGQTSYNVKLAPKGTPDLLTISPKGKITWIEVKAGKGKLRDSQVVMHHDLKRRGQRVIVAYNSTQIQECFD